MLTKSRKWFARKVTKQTNTQATNDQTDASAMSELAESLQKEIQGLSVEIKMLKKEREQLFHDIHDIMLSKSQAPDGRLPFPLHDPPQKDSPPTSNHPFPAQSLWLPNPLATPISDPGGVEMGLFGPRSRAPSLTSPSQPTKPFDSHDGTDRPRTRPLRSASDGEPVKNLEASTTPTRTAWRTVNRRGEAIHV